MSWKVVFFKNHVPRDTDTSGGRVKAPKTFMIRAISYENIRCATIRQFIICVRMKIRKSLTSKSLEIGEVRRKMKEAFVGEEKSRTLVGNLLIKKI